MIDFLRNVNVSRISRLRFVSAMIVLVAALIVNPPARAANRAAPAGTIAYATGQELRLVETDGSNDRLLFAVTDPELHSISSLAWHPDANQLAFTSTHETTCSLFRSDIFTIYPDGSNLQRITNHPACGELAAYAKGEVTVQIGNELLDQSIFLVYVEGAPEAKSVVVHPGLVETVTFTDVADFGDGVEQRVVVFQTEETNWIWPPAQVDVAPGQSVNAGSFPISNGNKAPRYGAYTVSWDQAAANLVFALGNIGPYEIAASPVVSAQPTSLFGDANVFASVVAHSPVGDEVLLYNAPTISRATPGDADSVAPLVELSGALYGMSWLPDGSGFLFAEDGGIDENFQPVYANVWQYIFASGELTQITDNTVGFSVNPSPSPDGEYIVFSYAASNSAPVEIKIMQRDGAVVADLGVSGYWPKWSPTTVTVPTPDPSPSPSPSPSPTPLPTATPIPQARGALNYLPLVQGN